MIARPPSLFDHFLALMPDAAVVVGGDGRVVTANPAAAALFGYPPGDLDGRPIETLVPERLRARHRAHRRAYATAPRARPMGAGQELTGRRQDGSEFPVDISLAPLPDAGDLVIAAVRDATERHAAQHARAELAHHRRVLARRHPVAVPRGHDPQLEPWR